MRSYYKILILEDVLAEATLIERSLKTGKLRFKMEQADSRDEFIEKLVRFKPDIILSDHALPQFDSIEALKLSREAYPEIPFILVTGAVSEEFAVKILKMGANDYIFKSNLSRLVSSILKALRQTRLEARKLKNQQVLHEQNTQLKKLNKELDNFVYSVSHNLRAPLASVIALIELSLKEKIENEKMLAYLGMMRHSVFKLDQTLKDILEYSRNSRLELKIEKIDLEELITNCFENLKYVSNYDRIDRNIVVHYDMDCFSDAYRMSVIFSNLVSNAIKYMDRQKSESSVDIQITVSDVISIVFSDNGIGIHEKLLPHVFTMFYRATDQSEGAGLGLYIVKEAVEKLNGIVSVESSLAQGTRFLINIPNMYHSQLKVADDNMNKQDQ